MWKQALLFLTAISSLAAETPAPKEATPPPAKTTASMTSYMMIPPSQRALDYQQAFEQMREEKSTGKVYFELADGSTVSNIIDMRVMENSTIILFRYTSNQEIRFKVVKVEDIRDLRY
jgi:hypothetical protein